MRFYFYTETLSRDDYYIIGVDTAASISGAQCAIELFSFKEFQQIGEAFGRVGSLTKFSTMVRHLTLHLANLVGYRLVLAIERNSIGQVVVEHFLEHDLHDYLYYEDKGKERVYGIQTTGKTKGIMTALLYEHICANPSIIKSEHLKNQLLNARRNTRGDIEIPKGYLSDLFMAASFCAYARKMWYSRLISEVDISDATLAETLERPVITDRPQVPLPIHDGFVEEEEDFDTIPWIFTE